MSAASTTAVIFIHRLGSVRSDAAAKAKAEQQGVAILQTELNSYELAVKISKLLEA